MNFIEVSFVDAVGDLVCAEPRVYLGIPWWGLKGQKFLILITLDLWKRHFREKNYIENYLYLLKSTKSRRNIIWADFFWRPYRTNGTKTRLGSPVLVAKSFQTYISVYCHTKKNWVKTSLGDSFRRINATKLSEFFAYWFMPQ